MTNQNVVHREDILRLRSQGMTYSQIQKELGCSKGTISYHCGLGQKRKTMDRQRDKRNLVIRYIQEYKQSKGCQDCGEFYPYWVLDFDHIGDDKLFNIGNKKNQFTLEQVKTEIEKCEVVCANCHRTRTFNRSLVAV